VPSDAVTGGSQQLPLLDIPRPFEPLSDVSNDSSHNGRDCEAQEAALSERLSQQPSPFSGPAVATTAGPTTAAAPTLTLPSVGAASSSPSSGLTGLNGPRDKSPSLHGKSKKKSKKHKDKEKSKEQEKERRAAAAAVAAAAGAAGEERVPEPSGSPENLKNSIPHRSTGTGAH